MAGVEDSGSGIRLVVGLGNPGRRYERTRHNVGFLVVDELVRKEQLRWELETKKWQAEVARGDVFTCLKPQTYMNLSGEAVASYTRFHKLMPDEIMVVYDDVDLELGVLRFRVSGSAGGHRGVASIISSLGTDRFVRLKVGVGRGVAERRGDLADHVLSKFPVDEGGEVEKTLIRAVQAIREAQSRGVEAAMNEFNQKPKTKNLTEQQESSEEMES
ncbi:MAG: aminoacyl-tRNA hydrolase [Verrucomicrobiota bacterium]